MVTKAKPKQKKEKVLDIGRELRAIDTKDYDFYKNLTDEERKEFKPYVLMRFISNTPSNDTDIQEWFVEMTNELVNKNFFELASKHPGLMWKLYAAVGVGVTCRHQYLHSLKPKFDKFESLLGELYPARKIEDIKLLAKLMNEDDREALFDDMGFDKKQRKEYK